MPHHTVSFSACWLLKCFVPIKFLLDLTCLLFAENKVTLWPCYYYTILYCYIPTITAILHTFWQYKTVDFWYFVLQCVKSYWTTHRFTSCYNHENFDKMCRWRQNETEVTSFNVCVIRPNIRGCVNFWSGPFGRFLSSLGFKQLCGDSMSKSKDIFHTCEGSINVWSQLRPRQHFNNTLMWTRHIWRSSARIQTSRRAAEQSLDVDRSIDRSAGQTAGVCSPSAPLLSCIHHHMTSEPRVSERRRLLFLSPHVNFVPGARGVFHRGRGKHRTSFIFLLSHRTFTCYKPFTASVMTVPSLTWSNQCRVALIGCW